MSVADLLEQGGPIRWCERCSLPHTEPVSERRGGQAVVPERLVVAAIARKRAILRGSRPLGECSCPCCAAVAAENHRLAEMIREAVFGRSAVTVDELEDKITTIIRAREAAAARATSNDL